MSRKTKLRKDSIDNLEEDLAPSFSCTTTEAVGDLVYLSGVSTVAQADASDPAKRRVIGWIFEKPTTTTCRVSTQPGPVTKGSGLTAGNTVYLSTTTPGSITESDPGGDSSVPVGVAASSTEYLFDKDLARPTFSGALVKRDTNFTVGATPVAIEWETTVYDTDSFFSGGNPTRLTVPSGVSKVRVCVNVQFTNSSGTDWSVYLLKNGVVFDGAARQRTQVSSSQTEHQNIVSAIVDVVAGDYFEAITEEQSGTVDGDPTTWFSIEVI